MGLLICFFSVYTGIAMVSYFFTGAADQNIVDNLAPGDLILKSGKVSNWAGLRGAYMSDVIMNRWFGIPSFFLLFFIGSIGFKLMKLCRINLFKRFLICSVLTVWASLLLAFVFSAMNDILFFHPGGQHGYYLSGRLVSDIGYIGVILLLLAGFILAAVFVSSRTVSVMQTRFSFGGLKKKSGDPPPKNGGEKPEGPETEEEDEEYDGDGPETDIYIPAGGGGANVTIVNRSNTGDGSEFIVEVAKEEEVYDKSELGTYDPRLDLSGYKFPDTNLLEKYEQYDRQVDMDEQNENRKRIKKTLEDFGISIKSNKATVGPTVTLYEVVPDTGVRIAKIKNLEDDIALNLAALGIRIIAPMPGKGTIGIEVPNKKPQIVSLESVIASHKFAESKYKLPVVLGRTITNDIFMFDLADMPHLLVAGATGNGKSVGLNAIIISLLYKKHPAELKFVLVDPKVVELGVY
ncbi:MAG: DNA translocase FtsK 4TM domain-containing protein, partial [Tannerella sp.]|nr:DNA translocase FtsK 4TM domain-containing protein [Tannerella sp.]